MVKSYTGFGKAAIAIPNFEANTVNSHYCTPSGDYVANCAITNFTQ